MFSAPTDRFELTKFKKDTTNHETYSFICNLFQTILRQKKEKKKVSLVVPSQSKESLQLQSPINVFTNHTLAGFTRTAIFTGELRAALLALIHIYRSKENLSSCYPIPFHPYRLYLTWSTTKTLELHIDMEMRLFLSGFLAMWALDKIQLQNLLLRMHQF